MTDLVTRIESKSYLVGGSVRDKLLGMAIRDLDYVVVGSNSDEMIEAGFTKVGSAFSGFIHPITRSDYSLARRKGGSFSEDVTLEEDLSNRDLTINSMALDPVSGDLIDPYNGQSDLLNKILRPTSDSFSEDPLRVIRAARFHAKLPEFTVIGIPKCSVEGIVADRIIREVLKALDEEFVDVFFNDIRGLGVFPDVGISLNHVPARRLLRMSLILVSLSSSEVPTRDVKNTEVHSPGSRIKELCELYKIPKGFSNLAIKYIKCKDIIYSMDDASDIRYAIRVIGSQMEDVFEMLKYSVSDPELATKMEYLEYIKRSLYGLDKSECYRLEGAAIGESILLNETNFIRGNPYGSFISADCNISS